MKPYAPCLLLALACFAPGVFAEPGDDALKEYFELETAKIEAGFLAEVKNKADWLAKKDTYRKQLFHMLGLSPNRERTDLKATITGKVEGEGFVVEKLHYQSSPGLYVTGNLYLPKERKPNEKFPAILYVCGHGRVKKDGVSYGNKVHYHHHGSWFARHGYVCLTIDTIQLGEIEGLHHGIYSKNMWWWASQGYTPAGVEAWNGIRGIDYLQSRPEVDGERIGVTGRSGGGAYSWWVAALDERVKAAVPVAGITSMRNHVVDGCVEGHCDCMYQVNSQGWDFAMISSLVAPRALLISNTDKDRIFPLDGVVEVHRKTKRVYDMLGASNNLGLQITEGPHKDTQDLRVHAFSWFNRFLKNERPLIDKPAVKYFEPKDLKVFDKLPEDEITSKIHDTFVLPQVASPSVPKDKACWNAYRKATMAGLKEHVFAGWPENPGKLSTENFQDFTLEQLLERVDPFGEPTKVKLLRDPNGKSELSGSSLLASEPSSSSSGVESGDKILETPNLYEQENAKLELEVDVEMHVHPAVLDILEPPVRDHVPERPVEILGVDAVVLRIERDPAAEAFAEHLEADHGSSIEAYLE